MLKPPANLFSDVDKWDTKKSTISAESLPWKLKSGYNKAVDNISSLKCPHCGRKGTLRKLGSIIKEDSWQIKKDGKRELYSQYFYVHFKCSAQHGKDYDGGRSTHVCCLSLGSAAPMSVRWCSDYDHQYTLKTLSESEMETQRFLHRNDQFRK